MPRVELKQLIETGAHFGHLTRRWNPQMKPYIFMEKNGIHIIDLKRTQEAIDRAAQIMTSLVSTGKRVLFVGTKKQAKSVIAAEAKKCEMNWVSERWLGGMLTNFATIRKSVKRMQNIEKMETDGTFDKLTKKEGLFLTRERDKLRKILDGVESLTRLPGALFVVDIKKEFISVREANRLNIPVFAIVDTNCDPDLVDYMIPANDDAVRAIELITKTMSEAVIEGLAKAKELKAEIAAQAEREKKEKETEEGEEAKEKKPKVRRVKFDQKDGKRTDKGARKKKAIDKKPAEETDEKLKEKDSSEASEEKIVTKKESSKNDTSKNDTSKNDSNEKVADPIKDIKEEKINIDKTKNNNETKTS
jgi:small subunit ribosomal protein S2